MNVYITLLITIPAGVMTICSLTVSLMQIFIITFIIGGALEIIISVIAFEHFKSDYIRQGEIIVNQAKLEDIIGLCSNDYITKNYWVGETILPKSFIKTRSRFINSEDFLNWFKKSNDIKISKILYLCFSIIEIVFIVIGVIIFICL